MPSVVNGTNKVIFSHGATNVVNALWSYMSILLHGVTNVLHAVLNYSSFAWCYNVLHAVVIYMFQGHMV